eukprot:TRINITY_DN108460_c0_g1_i1.p1 TRINITY_DN108460_c0_g1~~TRINITY_DN108460_c0_g1_i1.p1  ORF type:complete len:255 (-),score=32.91 TRINITY_DN108460_c0_g1_i1:115-840(-)
MRDALGCPVKVRLLSTSFRNVLGERRFYLGISEDEGRPAPEAVEDSFPLHVPPSMTNPPRSSSSSNSISRNVIEPAPLDLEEQGAVVWVNESFLIRKISSQYMDWFGRASQGTNLTKSLRPVNKHEFEEWLAHSANAAWYFDDPPGEVFAFIAMRKGQAQATKLRVEIRIEITLSGPEIKISLIKRTGKKERSGLHPSGSADCSVSSSDSSSGCDSLRHSISGSQHDGSARHAMVIGRTSL